ncbi:hypothetical protein KVR01_001375 [Diaporthe batatas]|uniref:uncharacterized protein n=1 Tax=Diaporthe batatas TaxID=748121 RepID=UPI001D046666|nr:uncharacterized protein KVR01_001375 [Diaporthe batatas]KAG8168626.1 hypothetical protein KVR01_001375 [Diaporthe batatas]
MSCLLLRVADSCLSPPKVASDLPAVPTADMPSLLIPAVCVVGSGLSGLATLKECLSEGFEAVCFEARPEIGGQWAHQPDVSPSDPAGSVQSSIYDGVVLNSCRDTSALTDFPLDPSRYGDYFGHRQQLQYMNEYAEHYGLRKHIRLSTRVVGLEQRENGSWTARVQEGGRDDVKEYTFDAVFVCAGHLSKPSVPEFRGRDAFRGDFMHSHFYRRPGPFDRKKVVLVGFGSSAVDIACEIAPGAEEVHVVTRRGGWVLPRYVLGKPTEAFDNRATQVWMPTGASQWLQTKLLQIVEGKAPEVMQPSHKILEQSPTIRGDFTEKVRTQVINVHRGSVEHLTQDGLVVSTERGEEELKADVIIACTGYDQFDHPFLPKDLIRSPETPENRVDLYKLIVSPRYDNLFMMGLVELVGSAAPAFEAQARWACAVVSQRIRLPSKPQMLEEVRGFQAWQEKHFLGTERHALIAHGVQYSDDLLEPLGAVPSFGKCLGSVFTSGRPWRALKVLNAVWFGIPSGAQWRLFGYGAKRELAEETLLRIGSEGKALSKGEVDQLASKSFVNMSGNQD